MTLLAPEAAITAAAITLPALIVLYLLKLRRRPVRVSTAMFWQAAEQDLQANVPWRWVRPSVLFLLHALILGALVLALGRPALQGGGVSRERVVLMLDCSASMSATDMAGGATRLAAAKEKAGEIVDGLARSGASACVVTFAGDAAVQVAMTTSRRVLLDGINSARATDQSGDLGAALALVESIARPSTSEGGDSQRPASVLLISDGGFAGNGELRARGARVRLVHVGPTGGGTPGAIESASHDNVGIVALAARRDADDPGTVRLFARLLNARDRSASLPVTLSLDGNVLERRGVTVPASGEGGPGQLAAGFEFLSPRGGLVMVSLGIQDALSSDNQAALTLPSPAAPAILVAHRHSAADDSRREARATALALLRDALTELRPRTLRVVDEQQLGAIFGSGEWRAYDLFVGLDAVPPKSVGIASLTFGAAPTLAGLTMEESPEASGEEMQGVLHWERQHPLLRSVPLDSLVISRAVRFRVHPGGERVDEVERLAEGGEGPLIVLERESGVGHVAVAFALEESNWPLQVSFPLFLANAVDYLTLRGASAVGRAYTTNEPITLAVDSMGRAKIRMDGPEAIEVDPGAVVDGKVTLGPLARAGVYVATEGRGVSPIAVSVLDATESSLAERGALEVGSGEAVAIANESPREIWPWFVVAAAGLLALEWVVYGLQMRV